MFKVVDHNWMLRKQRPQANGGKKNYPRDPVPMHITNTDADNVPKNEETPQEFTERMKAKYAAPVKSLEEADVTPAAS